MPDDAEPGHTHNTEIPREFRKLAAEFRTFATVALEHTEPVLRRAVSGDQPEWAGCSWCPVCATVAMIRGEHHDLLAVLAEHGVSIITILREALAGLPVDPIVPDPAQPVRPTGYHDIPVTIRG